MANLPNGTSEDVILHAATASWAGFVYQGICALCVAMEKLLSVPDSINWYLNVEGYEDFAILDADKHILSFHQCKDYKVKKSWKEEFEKMEDKRYYWNQKGMCKADVPLYFHINMPVNYSNGVVAYPYSKDSNLTPNIKEIYQMFSGFVSEYCNKENIPVPVERAGNRLVALIEKHVSSLDVLDKQARNQTQQISIDKSIPFSKIVDLIRTSEDDHSFDEKIRLSVFYLNYYMNQRLEEEPDADYDRVKAFLDSVNGMDKEKKAYFIKCLFPDINIKSDSNSATEISNSPRVNYLFNLLTGVSEDLDLKEMRWLNGGIAQSPSAVGNDKKPKLYCAKIAANATLPPELLRDFDWIVGCFDYSVPDILANVNAVTRVNDVDYNDITKARKTGLLSIKDKNDGRI